MQSYTDAKVADREKQSELIELHSRWQELGDRLDKCLNRLTSIGNRLVDETGQQPTSNEPTPKTLERMPGLVRDLYNDADGFQSLINKIESRLSKIENSI